MKDWTHADWDENKRRHNVKNIFGDTTLDFTEFRTRLNVIKRKKASHTQIDDIVRNVGYFWAMMEYEEGHDTLTMARRWGGDLHIPKTEIFELIL